MDTAIAAGSHTEPEPEPAEVLVLVPVPAPAVARIAEPGAALVLVLADLVLPAGSWRQQLGTTVPMQPS